MKTAIKVEKEVDIKTVQLKAGVRYWEDGTVNDVEDTEGNIPFRVGEMWCPEIEIETGKIINWPIGATADVHYKVCDNGSYYLKDENGEVVLSIEQDYVPNKLIPGDYGDYIIMKIDANGMVEDWDPSFEDFLPDEC